MATLYLRQRLNAVETLQLTNIYNQFIPASASLPNTNDNRPHNNDVVIAFAHCKLQVESCEGMTTAPTMRYTISLAHPVDLVD